MPRHFIQIARLTLVLCGLAACGGDPWAVDASFPALGSFTAVEVAHTTTTCWRGGSSGYDERWILSDREGAIAALKAGKKLAGATTIEIALTCYGCTDKLTPVPVGDDHGRYPITNDPQTTSWRAVAQVRKLDASCQPVTVSGTAVDGSSEKSWQASSGWFKPVGAEGSLDGWLSFDMQFPSGSIRGMVLAPKPEWSVPGEENVCGQRSLAATQGCAP